MASRIPYFITTLTIRIGIENKVKSLKKVFKKLSSPLFAEHGI